MKLDKAIIYLERLPDTLGVVLTDDERQSLQLGIEALKLLTTQPPEGYTCIPRPLPGETEEPSK